MSKKTPKTEQVKGLDELGTTRVTRAFNRGIREALTRDAAYRRSKKQSKQVAKKRTKR